MSDRGQPPNLYFRLVVVFSAAFIITILAMVAAMFGDQRSPMNVLINRHAGFLITVEVALVVVFGLIAMTVDRWHTLQNRKLSDSASTDNDMADGDC